MILFAQQIASFDSEPFEKYLIAEADLDSLDSLADKKEIREDKIACLEPI